MNVKRVIFILVCLNESLYLKHHLFITGYPNRSTGKGKLLTGFIFHKDSISGFYRK